MTRALDLNLSDLLFMHHRIFKFKPLNIDVLVCRCGYTGEDGFEISVEE